MKPRFLIIVLLVVAIPIFIVSYLRSNTGAPPYIVEDLEPPPYGSYEYLEKWQRPEGPPKVALQAGHWKNDELPDELERLKGSTGSSGGGKSEWEVNLAIAESTAKLLEEKNIQVEILPATIPPQFWADVFVAIHADGNANSRVSGFKVASPRRDFSGNADELVSLVESEYGKVSKLPKDENISHNMRGYYAFAWWRYEHAVHPKTVSIIIETGFLTNPQDRKVIVANPQLAAYGIAKGIIAYLESENLLK